MINKIKKHVRSIIRHNPFEKKISYAQCGEDLIIDFIFKQLEVFRPSYLDIGSHHPFYLSNTAIFYENGSRGINIEPNPQLFSEFKKLRNDDINLNIGVGDREDVADFYLMEAASLNTFSSEQVEIYKKDGEFELIGVQKIKLSTLENIISKYNGGQYPDFLSIDVEGLDELIIKSIDFNN